MRIRLTSLCFAAFMMAGCSSLKVETVVTPQPAAMTGYVYGGQQAIVGSQLQLYAVDPTNGFTTLLATPVTTSASGSFSLATAGTGVPLFTCPTTTTPVFLIANGGNPGLMPTTVSNSAIRLADALGDCGTLTSSTKIVINEATTVAFAAQYNQITAATTQTALEQAFATIAKFANSTTGTSPGSGQTSTDNGGTVPASKIYTLANVVAACVDTSGPSSTACSNFLADVPTNAGTPPDVLTALIDLQSESTTAYYNQAIFLLASPTGPFQPELASAPSDWFIQLAMPTLNGVLVANPTSGTTGNTITITSTNYTTSNAVCPFTPPLSIVIGGQQASGNFTTTQITATVPASATPGNGLGEVVTQYGTCTFPFTVN